jgi:hypothetical protein
MVLSVYIVPALYSKCLCDRQLFLPFFRLLNYNTVVKYSIGYRYSIRRHQISVPYGCTCTSTGRSTVRVKKYTTVQYRGCGIVLVLLPVRGSILFVFANAKRYGTVRYDTSTAQDLYRVRVHYRYLYRRAVQAKFH